MVMKVNKNLSVKNEKIKKDTNTPKSKQDRARQIDRVLDEMAERSIKKRKAQREKKAKVQAKIDALMDDRVEKICASLQAKGDF